MTGDLFDLDPQLLPPRPDRVPLGPGAFLFPGLALPMVDRFLSGIEDISAQSPFRHMSTPGGKPMSVAMTSCGPLGWVSDRRGYRYQANDPANGKPWPPMPLDWLDFANRAAALAGFAGFTPQACLINRYDPGARLSLHQDRDEHNLAQPIVSVSLGLPAIFAFGGPERSDKTVRHALSHGDVVVWGGPSRLYHHAVLPILEGFHPMVGRCRLNLTFRRVD